MSHDVHRRMAADREWAELGAAGVGLVTLSRWRVASPEGQRAVAGAIASVWASASPPDGLAGYTLFGSEDGRTVLHHAAWRDDAALAAFVASERDGRLGAVRARAPAFERVELHRYRPYRRLAPRAGAPAPGCLVTVEVALDPPGRARAWVDLVLEALAASEALPSGGISAQFLVSDDGARVLNLAEWVDAEAHRRALERGSGSVAESARWARVHAFPGARSRVTRHELLWRLRPLE